MNQNNRQQTTTDASPKIAAFSPASAVFSATQPAWPAQTARQVMPTMLPLVLLVLDGWGVAAPSKGNAISLAKIPQMDQLIREYPTMTLHASGEVVGLPWAEMGNSEVGHINIGCGKIIYQNLPLINKAIADGTFFKNEAFLEAIRKVKEQKSKLHLLGLVSDGGVHSSIDHLFALLEMCRDEGLRDNVFVHAILDGRDTEKNAGLGFIAKLETKMQEISAGKIASISGRFYAMDRDNHWERTAQAYNAMRHGQAAHVSDSPLKAIEHSYEQKVYDEEFVPTVIIREDGTPRTTVDHNDAMIFFNFRADRTRQLTKAFILPGFQKFNRGQPLENFTFVAMTEYEKNLPLTVAFVPDRVRHTVARAISEAGFRQLHIAETEKYAHVTFFFNGGREESYANEDRVLIPSPRVASYAEVPEMAVHKITQRIVQELTLGHYHFIVANFANADMVGHTGNLHATIKAVAEIDRAIGEIVQTVLGVNGTLIITADHGNAEDMVNLQTGEIIKEHSTNPVPFILINSYFKQQRQFWPAIPGGDLAQLQPVGVLSDVAPTVLTLMGLPIPEEMTSRSLIRL